MTPPETPGVPAWVRRFLEALLPDTDAGDVIQALADAAEGEGIAERWYGPLWWVRQIAAPSTFLLVVRLRRIDASKGRPSGGSDWLGEIRHAMRSLRRDPRFALATVGSLGLGIGATVAILNVANAVLVRPLPYASPDELVFVWNRLDGFDSNRLPLSGIQVAELRNEHTVFADVSGVWATTRTVSLEGGSVLASAAVVTPNFLSLLGLQPSLGRGFSEDEGAEGEATVLVSHAFWQRELGGTPDAVGRTIRVDGAPTVVVGILPADLRLVFSDAVGIPSRVDVLTPYPWVAAQDPGGPRFLRVVARLQPGVSVETAERAVQDVSARLRATYAGMASLGDLFSAVPVHEDSVRAMRPLILVLLVGISLFLLLTCVNVTSLFMARSTTRGREFAIRRCLGASKRGLTRLLVWEVGLIAAAGGVLGTVIGVWGVQLLWRLRPANLARVEDVSLDPWVLLATFVVVLAVGSLTALAPLFGTQDASPATVLRRASGGAYRSPTPRRFVVGGEVALSVVLVVGAVLLGSSLAQVRSVDLGFDPAGVKTFKVGISNRTFPTDEERARLAREVEQAIGSIPGVLAVGATSHIPLADWANWSGTAAPVGADEAEQNRYQFDLRSVTPGFFGAVGATLAAGRTFVEDDSGANVPVVVVDRAYVDRVFPDGEAVGRQIVVTRYINREFVTGNATIVGVVESIRDRSPSTPPAGQVFWPFSQSARWELTYAARVGGADPLWADHVRAAVAGVDRNLAVAGFRDADEYVHDALAPQRFASLLGGLFSVLALVLAWLGLNGVISYSARQRSGEIGIRLALGARGRAVFGSVIGEGLAVAGAGVGVGLVGAALLTRFLGSLLYEVDPWDLRVFAAVGVALLAVAVGAALSPALRAARLDPVETLRPR